MNEGILLENNRHCFKLTNNSGTVISLDELNLIRLGRNHITWLQEVKIQCVQVTRTADSIFEDLLGAKLAPGESCFVHYKISQKK